MINTKELMKFMKDKEFTNVRRWVVDNLDNGSCTALLRSVYDNLYDVSGRFYYPHCVVGLGLSINVQVSFCRRPRNKSTMACLTEIMARG